MLADSIGGHFSTEIKEIKTRLKMQSMNQSQESNRTTICKHFSKYIAVLIFPGWDLNPKHKRTLNRARINSQTGEDPTLLRQGQHPLCPLHWGHWRPKEATRRCCASVPAQDSYLSSDEALDAGGITWGLF